MGENPRIYFAKGPLNYDQLYREQEGSPQAGSYPAALHEHRTTLLRDPSVLQWVRMTAICSQAHEGGKDAAYPPLPLKMTGR